MSLRAENVVVTPTLVATTSQYGASDDIGGILPLLNCVLAPIGTGILESLVVTDASNQKAVLEVLVFDTLPAGGTYVDNGALALSVADLSHLLAWVHVAAADYLTVGSYAVANVAGLNRVVQVAATNGTTLWALVFTTGTPTYAAASDLKLRFGFQKN